MLAAIGFFASSRTQAEPAWWSIPQNGHKVFASGVVNDQNWAPANAGQLKNIATQAKNHFNRELGIKGYGAGPEIEVLCASFVGSVGDYAPVNVGQLKNVAKPFYDRLAQIHYNYSTGLPGVPVSLYPWDLNSIGENHAPANLGQLKNLFSFDLTASFLNADQDSDSLPDWIEWELINADKDDAFESLAHITGAGDFDGDELSNVAELAAGTRLDWVDSDLDGYSDGMEARHYSDPLSSGHTPSGTAWRDAAVSYYSDPNSDATKIVAESREAGSSSVDYYDNADEWQSPTELVGLSTQHPFDVDSNKWTEYNWGEPDYSADHLTFDEVRDLLYQEAPYKGRWRPFSYPGWTGGLSGLAANDKMVDSYCYVVDNSLYECFEYNNGLEQNLIRAERGTASPVAARETVSWLDVTYTTSGGFNPAGWYWDYLNIQNARVERINLDIPAGQRVSAPRDMSPRTDLLESTDSTIGSFKLQLSPRWDRHEVRYSHLTGSTHRKIQANGRPLPGGKPQASDESDLANEHFYVDALTRSLDYYTSDVYIPLGASELPLAVTRRHVQADWHISPFESPDSVEMMPDLRLDQPFGPGWTSNLTALAVVDSGNGLRRARVTDADGQTLEFLGFRNPSNPTVNVFVAVPAGLPDETTYQHKLSFLDDPDAEGMDENLLVVTKKHGGWTVYKRMDENLKNNGDFMDLVVAKRNGSPDDTITSQSTLAEMLGFGKGKHVYRIVDVYNGRLDHLRYQYAEPSASRPNPLIPSIIKDGRITSATIALEITQTPSSLWVNGHCLGGLVHSVKDPNENIVKYAYGNVAYSGTVGADHSPLAFEHAIPGAPPVDGFSLRSHWLSSVKQNVGNHPEAAARDEYLARYLYTINAENDDSEPSVIRHFCLSGIKDGENREWRIYYDMDRTKMAQTQIYPKIGSVSGIPNMVAQHATQIEEKVISNAPKRLLETRGEPMLVAHIVLPGGPSVTENMNWDQKGIASFYTMPVNGSVCGYKLTPKGWLTPQQFQDHVWPWDFQFSMTTRIQDAERNKVDYVFGDAAVPPGTGGEGAFLASNRPLPGDNGQRMLVGMTHMRIDHLKADGSVLGSEWFEFDPTAGMALKRVKDFSGNDTLYEYNDTIYLAPSPALQNFYSTYVFGGEYGYGPFNLITKHSEPTKETKVGVSSVPNRVKKFTYADNRALKTVYDSATDSRTEYEFLTLTPSSLPPGAPTSLLSTVRTKESIIPGQLGGTALKETIWSYAGTGSAFPAFNTKVQIWCGGGLDVGICETTYLVTDYDADSRGRTIRDKVAGPASTILKTEYDYDNNNNKTEIRHPRHFVTTYQGDGNSGAHKTLLRYDGRNRLVESKKPSYTYSYSSGGTAQVMGEEITRYWYFKDSRKEKAKDPRGAYTWFEYDERGYLSKTTQDLGNLGTKSTSRSVDIITETGYDWTGRPVMAIDGLGVGTSTEYDTLGRPVKVVRGTGTVPGHQVNAAAPFPSYTDEFFYTTIAGLPGNCGSSAFDYSGFKPVRIWTDRGDGIVDKTTFEYDCFYRETRRTLSHSNGAGSTSSLSTDTSYSTVTALPSGNPGGATSAVTKWDPVNGNIRSWFDAAGREICTDLDEAGTFGTIQRAIKYYTGFDAVWKTVATGTDNSTTKTAKTLYDAAGRPYKTISPSVPYCQKSVVSPYAWTENTGTSVVRSWYDAAGNVVKVGDPRSPNPDSPAVFTTHEYDGSNRLRGTILPAAVDASTGSSVSAASRLYYDLNGNLTTTIDHYGNATDTTYDAANLPTEVKLPAVSISAVSLNPPAVGDPLTTNHRPTTTTTYNKNGQPLTVVDANGKTTTNVYDSLGRLWRTTDPVSAVTYFTYDGAGRQLSVTDGLGKTTTFAYDGLGRPTRMKPNGYPSILTSYTDTPPSRFSTQTNGRYNTIKTTFDVRGRVKSVEHNAPAAAAENLTYIYDVFGNLASVYRTNDANGLTKVQYAYDALNRVVEEWSVGARHRYQYDLAGNRTRVTINADGTAEQPRIYRTDFDNVNRPLVIQEWQATHLRSTTYEYDAVSRQVGLLHGSGLYEKKGYDNAGCLVSQNTYASKTNPLPTPQRGLEYRRDANGNLRAMLETVTGTLVRATLNGYDNASRLVHETIDPRTGTPNIAQTHYQYDAGANRTYEWRYTGTIWGSHPTGSATATYTYGTFNELTGMAKSGANTTYGYDNDGNRTTRSVNGVLQNTYVYDRLNRLVEVRNASNVVTDAYAYDYRTRRVLRQDAGQTAAQAAVVAFAGGTSAQEFVRGSATPFPVATTLATVSYARGSDLGGGVGGLLYSLRPVSGVWQPSYTSYNARGDVIGKTNASKTATFAAYYQADGKWTATSGSTTDRQKANTKEEDPTGFLNEGFRYRDLATGVFLTRDPAGFIDGPNLYTYVRQNPWTMFDPEGLFYDDPDPAGTKLLNDPGLAAQINLKASQASASIAVGGAVAVATAGTVAPALVGAGASTSLTSIVTGSVSGLTGDLASQATEAVVSGRRTWDKTRTATATVLGGALGYVGQKVGEAVSAFKEGFNAAKAASPTSSAAVTTSETQATVQAMEAAKGAPGPMQGPSPLIHSGAQGKHIPGHNNFQPGKSTLTADPSELGRHAGTGQQVGKIDVGLPGSKERVNFGQQIGDYVDPASGIATPTTNGIIHYGGKGIHIVPARP